jgi:hypothetical protein
VEASSKLRVVEVIEEAATKDRLVATR